MPENKTKTETVIWIDSRLKPIVPKFLQAQIVKMGAAREALKRRDFKALATFGHMSKGTCGGYGFFTLGELGGRLEVAANSEDFDNLRKVMAAMELHMESIKIEYR